MTRRKFIKKVITAATATVGLAWQMLSKASPRKFVRAFKVKKYPGSLRPLGDISQQSNWSG
jgi:hypothetical protein